MKVLGRAFWLLWLIANSLAILITVLTLVGVILFVRDRSSFSPHFTLIHMLSMWILTSGILLGVGELARWGAQKLLTQSDSDMFVASRRA